MTQPPSDQPPEAAASPGYPSYPAGPYGSAYPPPPPGYPAAGPYPTAPPPAGTSGFAITSLILGILPLCAGVLGVIFGVIALNQIKRTGQRGRGLAITGIACGSVWMVLTAVVVILAAAHPSDHDRGPGRHGSDGSSSPSSIGSRYTVGDCYEQLNLSGNADDDERMVTSIKTVPCSAPHRAEVYDKLQMTGSAPLTDDELTQQGQRCVDSLETYAPSAYRDDGVEVKYVYPLKREWATGDRTMVCVATFSAERTGSIKGK